jgi:hypothetical protein
MTASNDVRTWALEDQPITGIVMNYDVTFQFARGPRDRPTYAEIAIGTPFTVGGTLVDPENRTTLQPLLTVPHEPLAKISVEASGTLRLFLSNGTLINMPKREDGHESWNSHGPGELHDFNMLCSAHDVPPWGESTGGPSSKVNCNANGGIVSIGACRGVR